MSSNSNVKKILEINHSHVIEDMFNIDITIPCDADGLGETSFTNIYISGSIPNKVDVFGSNVGSVLTTSHRNVLN